MRILGIDPGLDRCGFGVVDYNQNLPGGMDVVEFGCITTSAKDDANQRLLDIYTGLNELVLQHNPRLIAVEKLFFNKNSKTIMMIGEVIGVVKLIAMLNDVELSEFTPLQVKMDLTGYGQADKYQVKNMVKVLFKLPAPPEPDDAADGLAITYSCAIKSKLI